MSADPDIDADGFRQITDEVRLQGNGVQVAKQFRDGVLHPVLHSLHQDQGGKAVLAFLSCLLLQAEGYVIFSDGKVPVIAGQEQPFTYGELQAVRNDITSDITAIVGGLAYQRLTKKLKDEAEHRKQLEQQARAASKRRR